MTAANSEQYSFCELAPLYILEMLSPSERVWVEQQVAADPELAAELAELAAGAASLAYGLPQPTLNPDVQARLFAELNLPLPEPEPAAVTAPSFVALAQDWQWESQPTPGIEIALIYTDEVKREVVGVLRAAAGVRYPQHRHAAVEELYMLEGDLIDGATVYGPGDYIRSQPGSAHAPFTTGGCMFFFRTSMDDEYPEVENSELISV
jgi:hypothetical protein